MLFKLIRLDARLPKEATSQAFLVEDKWDDWAKFRTQFQLVVFDAAGERIHAGDVKIGQKGLKAAPKISPGKRAPQLPEEFNKLDKEFFSLGQSESYYEALNGLDDRLRGRILKGLRDIANDLRFFEENHNEDVMLESLLREVQASNVRGRLHRLSNGDATLTEYDFSYVFPGIEDEASTTLDFKVVPESMPPSNVHVLIGRNGVGKTHCMRQIALSLLGRTTEKGTSPGKITKRLGLKEEDWSFAGVVLISFSAFDSFNLEPESEDDITSKHVGLRYRDADGNKVKTFEQLANDFARSLEGCREGPRAKRWRAAVEMLESDDLFAEANVTSLLDLDFEDRWLKRASRLFEKLSSGHAIVLLTVTRLIELVDEKTLVLLDEPEGHLHPPLLAAFVRCLSDLLVSRNGVAIIATHSPVVLQEVPRFCAWKLRRSSSKVFVERPTVETFGENIGVLTREVFSYEVTRSGFHQLLNAAVDEQNNYLRVVSKFKGQLGAEAKAIVQGLIAQRDADSEDDDEKTS